MTGSALDIIWFDGVDVWLVGPMSLGANYIHNPKLTLTLTGN